MTEARITTGTGSAAVASPRKNESAKTGGMPRPGGEDDMVNVRRRQGRSVTTRRNILTGALAEFATAGFGGATTRSIADRAGVQHGLVIYHFETKLGVWQAVIEDALRQMHENFVQALASVADADAETKLRAIYCRLISFAGERPEIGWLFSHEFSNSSERLHWLLEQIAGEDLKIIVGLIRELQALGRHVPGDPAHLHFLFVGAATRVFGLPQEIEKHVGVSPFDPSFINRHADLCIGLFLPPTPQT